MDIDSYYNKKEWKENDQQRHMARIFRRTKSKRRLLENLKKTKGERIFVFHYPPQGVFDIIKGGKDNPMNGKSAGIGFFSEAIKKYKPKLIVCGHMHEYQGVKRIYGVPVINPGDAEKGKYAIIEIDKNNKLVGVKFINWNLLFLTIIEEFRFNEQKKIFWKKY